MNFSYYADDVMGEDDGTLYTIVDGYDNSSGCTHYDYQASGWVSGPGGYFQQDFGGLSSYINVPIVEGNYSFGSNVTVNCSCFGSGLGAGGGYGTETVDPIPSGEHSFVYQWTTSTEHQFRAHLVLLCHFCQRPFVGPH